MDLRVSTASFDRVTLIQLMGGHEILPHQMHTFVSIDFYNHDSKTTDQAEGYDVSYNTLFSFRNVVDDFYLKFLDNEHIVADVYAVPISQSGFKPNGAIKLGTAKLPLIKVIENDSSFQAQEITNGDLKVGKLLY